MRPKVIDQFVGVSLAIKSAVEDRDYGSIDALLSARGALFDQLSECKAVITGRDWELLESTDALVQEGVRTARNSLASQLKSSNKTAQAIHAYRRS